jgi:hypothetical protein
MILKLLVLVIAVAVSVGEVSTLSALCWMINGSYDASEASFDTDADRRSSIRSEKSFDPVRADGGEQDLSGFEEGRHSVPKTISAAIAERAMTSIRNVASQELERLRSEVESLRAALELSERR